MFRSRHTRALRYEAGLKVYTSCPNCNVTQATPAVLPCIGCYESQILSSPATVLQCESQHKNTIKGEPIKENEIQTVSISGVSSRIEGSKRFPFPRGQGYGFLAGYVMNSRQELLKTRRGKSTLNMPRLKRPSSDGVGKLGEEVPAQVPSSSFDHGLELRGLPPKALVFP
ncbi:hypothetical protein TNCV_4599091 [Trichonephila clavipes]|nr:hypothetical protein TNCV_4599091 [Trichonephila clavipes]